MMQGQTNIKFTVMSLFYASYKERISATSFGVAGSIPEVVIDKSFRQLNLGKK
jgi:hypothetical protein